MEAGEGEGEGRRGWRRPHDGQAGQPRQHVFRLGQLPVVGVRRCRRGVGGAIKKGQGEYMLIRKVSHSSTCLGLDRFLL